jgi:hypothetical protein
MITIKIMWDKTKDFVIKYWKYIASFFLGISLLFLVKKRPEITSEVVKKEIQASKDIQRIETQSHEMIKKAEVAAESDHEERVVVIRQNEEEETKKAKKDFEDRFEDNKQIPIEDLANRFGDTFGVNVVKGSKDE